MLSDWCVYNFAHSRCCEQAITNRGRKTQMPDLDPNGSEELDEAMLQIGALLAELSNLEQTPTSFSRRRNPRTAAELSAKDSAKWLDATLHEQGWLCLDDDIPNTLFRDDAFAAALGLFELLGAQGREADFCLSRGAVGPILTAAGADRLIDRLEAATRHAEAFAEQLKDMSRPAASEAWTDAWDAGAVTTEQPSRIVAQTTTWPILSLSYSAAEGQLILSPSYQRDDVWPLRNSQELIESILRGIPLPSIVLLNVPAKPGESERYEVVDGKQRLTSILRFIGKHPKAIAKVDQLETQIPEAGFKSAFEQDYPKFRKLWNQHFPNDKLCAETERRNMLPFKLRTGSKLGRIELLKECEGKYYTQIRTTEITPNKRKVSALFEHGTEYNLAVIIFSSSTPRQIHEVFNLYNRQGKQLNAEEIRNAVYHEIDLTRALLAATESNRDIETLLPSASTTLKADLRSICAALSDPSIPTIRYRKAKLLGWMFATVFALEQNAAGLRVTSTAGQINNLLDRCMLAAGRSNDNLAGSPLHCLTSRAGLEASFAALRAAADHLIEQPIWAPRFKDDGSGTRWQDLQFVAALTAMFIARVTLGESLDERVRQRARPIYEATAQLLRPAKSQNKTQWAFIGNAVVKLLHALELEPEVCSTAFAAQFKCDPMAALLAAQSLWNPEFTGHRAGRPT